jgi:hypothetical protein
MSSQTKIKIPHLCSPTTYDEYLDKILLAIYRLGKASTSKDIVGKDSSLEDHVCVGRAASFLSYIGLVEGERSPFNLSPLGRQIAIALHEGRNQDALNLWQKALTSHNLYSELQKYIEAQGGRRGTSLGFAEHLRTLAGKDWVTRYVQEGGKRLCVLFANKGLLTFDRGDDAISFPTGVLPPTTPPTAPPTALPTTPPTTPPTPPGAGVRGTLAYTINIVIEAKDADSIKQVINLIRELTGRKAEPS